MVTITWIKMDDDEDNGTKVRLEQMPRVGEILQTMHDGLHEVTRVFHPIWGDDPSEDIYPYVETNRVRGKM